MRRMTRWTPWMRCVLAPGDSFLGCALSCSGIFVYSELRTGRRRFRCGQEGPGQREGEGQVGKRDVCQGALDTPSPPAPSVSALRDDLLTLDSLLRPTFSSLPPPALSRLLRVVSASPPTARIESFTPPVHPPPSLSRSIRLALSRLSALDRPVLHPRLSSALASSAPVFTTCLRPPLSALLPPIRFRAVLCGRPPAPCTRRSLREVTARPRAFGTLDPPRVLSLAAARPPRSPAAIP